PTAYSGPNGYSNTWTAWIGPSVASAAQRSAATDPAEPSTPTTTGLVLSTSVCGTTATGQGAAAATFRLTDPSVTDASRPRPRVPTATRSASGACCTIARAGSPRATTSSIVTSVDRRTGST